MGEQRLHLFRKMVSVTGEDALTEALAGTLRKSSLLQRAILRRAGVEECDLKVDTRPLEYVEGVPDLRLMSPQHLLLFEIKVEAPLSAEQWNRYRSILERHPQIPIRRLLAIVGRYTEVDREVSDGSPASVWGWADVYRLAKEVRSNEEDPVAGFLLS